MSEKNGHSKNGKHQPPPTPPPQEPGEKKRCGSPLRNKPGRFCRSTVLYPNGRCKMHGGPTPSGIASHSFKHGRRSKHRIYHLPHHLEDSYAAAINDPELLDLSKDVAAYDVRIQELFTKLSSKETEAAWKRLGQIWEKFEQLAKGDEAAQKTAMKMLPTMGQLIKSGRGDHHAWRELRQMMLEKSSLTKSEMERRRIIGATIPVEQAGLLLHAVADLIKANVKNRDDQARLQRGLMALANRNAGVIDSVGRSEPTEDVDDRVE